ncbi:MAG: Gfo/Idh/MocA family protein [Phycisphaerae bacterium]
MSHTVRWGILGTGSIAHKFAEGLKFSESGKLLAVGSRTAERAERFAAETGAERSYRSYEDLVGDKDVDAVYVATPHPRHKGDSLLCISHDKPVLCEKPFTVNAAEADEVIATARRREVFCMEAMWTRFVPSIVKLRELLAEGAIGDVRVVAADFGFRTQWNPEGRLLNPELAGGALLDVGVYPISLASMVLGTAQRVTGLADMGETGVDEQAGIVCQYDAGKLAVLTCAVRTRTPHEATIMGTDGYIRLHEGWYRGSAITLHRHDGEEEHIEPEQVGNGYNYEADEVARCLADDKTESDIMPLDETLSIIQTMDEIRTQWGLRYPFE